jgi:hypothetical protein
MSPSTLPNLSISLGISYTYTGCPRLHMPQVDK